MINVGSRVAARLNGAQGVVISRSFDEWERDWFYEVAFDQGGIFRLPFLALTEITCADSKAYVKMESEQGGN